MRRRQRMLEDLERDIHEHIERETQDNIDRGMSPEEARYAARRKFGNVRRVREDTRAVWTIRWLEELAQDLRFGLRLLRKSPGFTAVAVLTLALGIGANTAIFSLIDAIMLRNLPIRDPQQLQILRWAALKDPSTNLSYFWSGCPGTASDPDARTPGNCVFSYPMYEQIRSRSDLFSATSGMAGSQQHHVKAGGQVTLAEAYLVSGDFFETLGTRAALGRTFTPADDVPGAPDTVLLSYSYWQSRFGGNPSIIGKTILLANTPFTVIGVAAPGFKGIDPGLTTDLWIPLSSQDRVSPYLPKHTAANSLYLEILARLKPGVSAAQAQSALTVLFANSTASGPAPMFKPADAPRIELKSAAHGLTTLRQDYSQPLYVLMASVGIILLIACANVGGLSLARATSRRQEIAMRFTLGATRGRIVRQLLTESFLVAAAGAALGILLAYWSAEALAAFLSANSYFTLDLNVAPNATILAFTIAIATLTGILFGLAPALQGMRVDLAPVLKAGGARKLRFFSDRRFGFGSLLVVGQVALSVVVLAGAGLLVHTLIKLRATNIGFQPDNVLLISVDMGMTGYKLFDDPHVIPLDRDLQARFASLPGVKSASYSMVPLLSGGNMTSEFAVPDSPGRPPLPADELPVGPNFFETMQIPLLSGRSFTSADFLSKVSPEPVVINELFARKLFGDANALGRLFGDVDSKTPRWEVIGVVRDAKYNSLREQTAPTVYSLLKAAGATFELRTAGNTEPLIPLVRAAVKQVNGNLLVSEFKTQTEQIDNLLYQERLIASLSSLFAALALLLDCIGLYGLLSYEVAQRTREIGIRIALGAEPRSVLRLFIRRGFALVVSGAVMGVAVAFGLTRYLQSLLFGVRPTDPYTFAAAIALLAIVAALACAIPARRATRVDPMVALRYE